MTINNVSRRASKAMLALCESHEKCTDLMGVLKGKDFEILMDAMELMGKAQQELVKILAQDNKVEVEG